MSSEPQVAVLRLQGVIASGARGGLSDAGLAPLIEKAFRKGKPKAVALVINSPGGSPAQSSLIAARIRRLADEKKVKVHAFVEDVAASGGYWLACAADDIYTDATSIVGSIGVISAGFGFHELLERYGVERRVYTAGKSKSMLDPFRPEQEADVARLRAIQDQLHETFIDHVKTARGAKLGDGDYFTGEIWVGQKAVDIGLTDGVAHLVPKMKELYGKRTNFRVYQQRRPLLTRIGGQMALDAAAAIDERAAFARFGL
ncbi:MAG: S49 family peptidase [Pseudomonadota bacterium]